MSYLGQCRLRSIGINPAILATFLVIYFPPLIADAQHPPGTRKEYLCHCPSGGSGQGNLSCQVKKDECPPHPCKILGKASGKGGRCEFAVVPNVPPPVINADRSYPVCENWNGKARFSDKQPEVNYFRSGKTLTGPDSTYHNENEVCIVVPSHKTIKGVFCGARETTPTDNINDVYQACSFSGNRASHSDCPIGAMAVHSWVDQIGNKLRRICYTAENWADRVRLGLIEVYTD